MDKRPSNCDPLAWARLLRLSNAPSAVADVLMGMAVATGGILPAPSVCVALVLASLSIYLAGMALNDAIDAPRDAAERPERPIPSGRVSRRGAYTAAACLMFLGIAAAAYAAVRLEAWSILWIVVALIAAVIGYDGPYKKTVLGPPLMGACRGLNVLLGMSPALTWGAAQAIAPGVALYVAGITWVASQEAGAARRGVLAWGALVSLSGLVWLAVAPWRLESGLWPKSSVEGWWLLWGVVFLMIGRHYAAALLTSKPLVVRRAVGGALQGIVLVDAVLAAGYVGPYWGMAVLVLLPLTMLASRWLPPT